MPIIDDLLDTLAAVAVLVMTLRAPDRVREMLVLPLPLAESFEVGFGDEELSSLDLVRIDTNVYYDRV